MTTLIREPINKAPNLADLDDRLAFHADVLLGYTALRKRRGVAGPLGRALKSLEIEPFTRESVKAYQEEVREAAIERVKREFPGSMSRPEWSRRELAGYEGDIPPHVINRAVSVKQVLGAVAFWIEEIAGDPFLVAVLGEEEFYIDQWDEEEFAEK